MKLKRETEFSLMKKDNLSILKNIINDLKIKFEFNSHSHSKKLKILSLEMFEYEINQNSKKIYDYLVGSGYGSFQHDLLFSYLKIVEENLPIIYIKNKETVIIDNIHDPRLGFFSTISKFSTKLNSNLELKNNSPEIYVGGIKATVIKNHFIGKLISVKTDGKDITNLIVNKGFHNISFKDLKPGTNVDVEHLSILPHYGVGALGIINKTKNQIKLQLQTQ